MPQKATVLDLNMAGGFFIKVGDFAYLNRKVDTKPMALEYNGYSACYKVRVLLRRNQGIF